MRRFPIRFLVVAALTRAAAGAPETDSPPLVRAGPEPQAAILFLGTTGGAIEPCL